MFKSNGCFKIVPDGSNKLHFSPIPVRGSIEQARILLLHSGLEDKQKRIEKYNFYLKHDMDSSRDNGYHSYLNNEKVQLRSLADIIF